MRRARMVDDALHARVPAIAALGGGRAIRPGARELVEMRVHVIYTSADERNSVRLRPTDALMW